MIPEPLMELLQRLKAMTIENGCTPAEAENAACRLKAMLDKHQLSIADVGERKLGEEVIRTEQKKVGDYLRIPQHIQIYACSIAEGYSCKIITGGGRYGSFLLSFLGLKSDAAVASFFFETTLNPVLADARRHGKAKGLSGVDLRQYVEAFLPAVGFAICKRLKPANDNAAGALVPLKKAKVDEWLHDNMPRGKRTDLSYRGGSGARDGRVYGEQMPLQSGIDASNTKARALA